jgi:formyl-CoA transferase
VTTSLIAEGIWASAVSVQAALCDAKFYPLHDRKNPPNAIFNVYQTADDRWFLIVMQPKDWPALVAAVEQPDLASDPRFAEDAARAKNSAQLAAILDKTFTAQPLAHWHDVFERARITYGIVKTAAEVATDPQVLANDIIVPIEGGSEHLTRTVSSPIRIHGVPKAAARRAPELGEHNDEILKELGFTDNEIEGFRAGGSVPLPAQQLTAGGAR